MFNVFDPKWTPSQRATIQSIIIILLGAIITGLSVVSDTLAKGGTIDYHTLFVIAIVTIAISFGHGLATYFMAHNADMALIVSAATQVVEKRFGNLVPPSVQQDVNTSGTQQNAQQGALTSSPVQSTQPSTPPQNVTTAPINVIPARPKVNLVPLPSEDMPTTLTETPLAGDRSATAGLPTDTQPRQQAVQPQK